MKKRLCTKNPSYTAISSPKWLLSATPCLLVAVLQLLGTVPAAGEDFPLPPWFIYGGGINGTWGGSSTSPDNAQLSVTMNPPAVPNQHVSAVATGSSDLLQITPATTYTLTLSAVVSGSATCETFMVDGSAVVSHTTIYSSTWKRYTNAFTTGGPDDPLVGRYLNVQLVLMKSGFNYGTATATFTNLQFAVSTVCPALIFHSAAAGSVRLQWSTNFYWYIPEHTTSLEASVWEDLTNQQTIQGDRYEVQVETAMGQNFFRLRQP